MKLEWNIPYEFIFNRYYPVDLKILFKIPIQDNRMIYMEHLLKKESNEFVVIIDTQKFIRAWRQSENNVDIPNYHLGDENLWRADYKFHLAEKGFQGGLKNPVPIYADGIGCSGKYPNCNISISGGCTRTIWLLANKAEYFPVVTKHIEVAHSFLRNTGRNGCAIYPCQGLYEQWYQDNDHLLPQAPNVVVN